MEEKVKATHEIVNIGSRSAHHTSNRLFRRKRGFLTDITRHRSEETYSSPDHVAGFFTFVNPVDGTDHIFCCDIKVKEIK